MNISQEGLALIKKFEGCELEAYKCAAGVWTIGYGSTKGVKEGDTITQEDADKLLAHEMNEYEGYIHDMVTVDLKQHQFDALVSWVFNLGPTNLAALLIKVLSLRTFTASSTLCLPFPPTYGTELSAAIAVDLSLIAFHKLGSPLLTGSYCLGAVIKPSNEGPPGYTPPAAALFMRD